LGTDVELCIDFPDPGNLCGAVNPVTAPIVFPTSTFPGEAFWWMGEFSMDRIKGASTLLVMALEAAFSLGETPAADDQIAFTRTRVRMSGLIPNAEYIVKHPYATRTVTTDDTGFLFETEDIGSLTTPADFSLALDSPVLAELLKWDPAVSPLSPATHLGDPNVEHAVIGNPIDQHFFRVEGPARIRPPSVRTHYP
jgi:hypothetical protein